jgi:phage baseplate assembly protein W
MAGYTDIDITCLKQRDGDVRLLEDVDAINANLYNIALTMQGSRRMMPQFAYNAYDMLFKNMTDATATQLGYVILAAIESWEDRIDVTNINVEPDSLLNRYIVTVSYTLKSFSITSAQTLAFILKKL